MSGFSEFSSHLFLLNECCCPLCSSQANSFGADSRRHYLKCGQCQLIFVPPSEYLDSDSEKAEYDLHNNDVDDPGYRKFLSRLCDPVSLAVPAGAVGLEFGCGPGPALAIMLRERGYRIDLYDIFYHPDESVFDKPFDFITATEVVEHLHRPRDVLLRLWRSLKPGGVLGLMTKLATDRAAFARWHYKNDLTHVCFFSRPTFEWLAQDLKAELEIIGSDVILLRKSFGTK